MAPKPFPILFIGPGRIGDAVLASGLIRKLAAEIPRARFTIAVGPAAAPLFADVPGLDALIVMQKEKGSGHWFKLWNQVRHTAWGLVVDTRGSAIHRFLRTRRRAIHRKSGGEPVHKVIEAARLLKLESDPPPPFLYVSEERQAAADALLGQGGPILAMGPAANWFGKTWPLDRFASTAKRLISPDGPLAGGRLVILGGPEDVRYVDELRRSLPRDQCIDLTGQLDLLSVHAVLRRASLFVGNDSGLMHLAAAAGAPTVGLFGPSDDRLYAPWGPHGVVVRGPRAFEQFRDVDPGLNQTIGHMMDLQVDTVVEAATALLKRSDPLLDEARSHATDL
ncbi:MAG: glycosyltransferase family 9 protein [Caulobacter sp.]|nr:glycosyltransferase family 9 protein [Caulobacter sp.]